MNITSNEATALVSTITPETLELQGQDSASDNWCITGKNAEGQFVAVVYFADTDQYLATVA